MLKALNLKIEETEETSYNFFERIQEKMMDKESQKKTIGSIEEELFKDIMELGRRMLQEHVDKRGDGDVGKLIEREDGKKLPHKRRGEKQLETLFGRIKVERIGYGYPEEQSIFPQDKEMGLPENMYSYPIQKRVCREAVLGSYDEIDKTLSEYTGAHVPKRQCMGIIKQGAEYVDEFYKQRGGRETEAELIVLSGDGKGIVMRPEGLREKTREREVSQKMSKRVSKGEKRNKKREAMAAAVYNIKTQVRSVDDIIEELDRDKTGKEENKVCSEEKRVWASIKKEKDEVFEEILEEGLKRNPTEKKVVFLSDGAKSVQKRAEEILRPGFEGKSFVIILDLIHVIEYLWKAAYVFYEEGSSEAELWVKQYLRMILEGNAKKAAAEMKRLAIEKNLSKSKQMIVDKAAGYILNNQEYMRYDEYLASGYPIATGVIEGVCGHLIKDRFEISGARWGLDGAESLLKLRAVYQSGDWDEYWKFHTEQSLNSLYPKNHWVSANAIEKPKLIVIQGGKTST